MYHSTLQLSIRYSGWQRLAVEDLGDGGLPECAFYFRNWEFQTTESLLCSQGTLSVREHILA